MLRSIIYILILSLFSCASSKKEIRVEGKYSLDSKEAFGELVISENHKFDYRFAIDLINTKSQGTWEIIDNYLILTSDSNYEHNKIEVEEFKNKESLISIRFDDNNPVVMADIFINKDTTKVYTTNKNGEITLPNDTELLNFTIYYLGESYDYKVNDGKSFSITLFPDDLSKTYFYKRKYKLKNNKLIDPEYNWKYHRVNK